MIKKNLNNFTGSNRIVNNSYRRDGQDHTDLNLIRKGGRRYLYMLQTGQCSMIE